MRVLVDHVGHVGLSVGLRTACPLSGCLTAEDSADRRIPRSDIVSAHVLLAGRGASLLAALREGVARGVRHALELRDIGHAAQPGVLLHQVVARKVGTAHCDLSVA